MGRTPHSSSRENVESTLQDSMNLRDALLTLGAEQRLLSMHPVPEEAVTMAIHQITRNKNRLQAMADLQILHNIATNLLRMFETTEYLSLFPHYNRLWNIINDARALTQLGDDYRVELTRRGAKNPR